MKSKSSRISEIECKNIIIDMLSYFHDFCVKNDIGYFVGYGTCLGAIRHHGFIPWDDDADLIMTRHDYTRLLSLWKDTDQYALLSNDIHGDKYLSPLPKIIDKRTTIKQLNRSEKFSLGLYVDIFIVDFIDDSKKTNEIISKAKTYSLQYVLRTTKLRPIKSFVDVKANIELLFYKALPVSFFVDRFKRLIDNNVRNETQSMAVLNFTLYNKFWPAKVFAEAIDVEFDRIKLKAPKEFDAYLKTTYGDYWELPPEDERIAKHSFDAYWAE